MAMSAPIDISRAEARRLALNAQGFGAPCSHGRVNVGHVRRLLSRLRAIQIDAVNVLVRSHYLPVYSRLGVYSLDTFDRLVYDRKEAFEYLGHAASYMPVELQPALRWRMSRYADNKHWKAAVARIEAERPGYLDAVEREITERGPLTVGDLSDPARREKVPTKYAESSLLWYRWSDGKTVLEGLFEAGRLAVTGRRNFERLYDLPERVIPDRILNAPTPSEDEAQRLLVRHAAAALGVATVRDLADYFRLPVSATRARIRELAADGLLVPADVQDWEENAYVEPEAKATPVEAATVLSPFDSLLWERSRVERIFGFQHSFELYVPRDKRRYGYYVLPFLLGESLVARIDLKADRSQGALLVLGAHLERGQEHQAVARPLAAEVTRMATWLGAQRVEVADNGDLATDLQSALQ
jgi:uncharacterized protein